MRIISGQFRGRKLIDSKNLKTLRPTTDMAREALFNILFSARFLKETDFNFQNCNFLDLCCGSGAVGFEALSRGAKSVTFIDNNSDHIDLAKKNAESLKLGNEAKILKLDARKLPKNNEIFEVIFIDPPYEDNYLSIVESLAAQGWIADKTLIIIEFKTRRDINEIQNNLKLLELRSYGQTSFGFFTSK
jgi:16S rRNA (guanine966-N2)-methyltransferase